MRAFADCGMPEGTSICDFVLRWFSVEFGPEVVTAALDGSRLAAHWQAMLWAKTLADERRKEYARRNDPIFMAAERARKRADRAAAHAERLRLKALRDADRQRT